jgi:hypothetical protein
MDYNKYINKGDHMNNFKEFLDYCESFYSPTHSDPLYPIDDLCEEGTHVTWGGGDSLDRERVRDLVINRRSVLQEVA